MLGELCFPYPHFLLFLIPSVGRFDSAITKASASVVLPLSQIEPLPNVVGGFGQVDHICHQRQCLICCCYKMTAELQSNRMVNQLHLLSSRSDSILKTLPLKKETECSTKIMKRPPPYFRSSTFSNITMLTLTAFWQTCSRRL